MVELRRKWSRLCHSLHEGRHSQNHLSSSTTLYINNQSLTGNNKSYSYTSSYPWWPAQNSIFPDSNSITFADSPPSKPAVVHGSNPVPKFRRQQSCTIEFNFGTSGSQKQDHQVVVVEPCLDSLKSSDHDHQGKEVKITLALGNSVFSDESAGKWMERKSELRAGQRAEMCKLLKENVPWQSETIPSIVEAIIDSNSANKQQTWLLIQGNDSIGKRRLAHSIAESLLGSADLLLHLHMNKKYCNNNIAMNQQSETLSRTLKTQRKLVVLVEDIDLADTQFTKFLADGFETGKFGDVIGKDSDAGHEGIFILTKNTDTTSHEDRLHDSIVNQNSVIQMTLKVDEKGSSTTCFGSPKFDHHKRKAQWELCKNMAKNPRKDEKENTTKKDFSRQSSFNSATLDLNIKADEEDNDEEESEDKPGELSPISSDLTRETNTDHQNPHGFLDAIDNLFFFKRSPARDREMAELFSAKMEECVEEAIGNQNGVRFSVEERVIERVCVGSGSFPNSLFEKWLKDVFQTSLRTGKFGGKEGMVVRLCLGGGDHNKDGINLEDGFMGSCLPKKIQLF